MPKTKTVTVYSLSELKDSHPEAYRRVCDRWESLTLDGGAPLADEVMDSLRRIIAVVGFRLDDWSIGADGGWLRATDLNDDDDDGASDLDRLSGSLARAGWPVVNGNRFPGNCPLTGYCADDDLAESLWKSVAGGASLADAVRWLADDAARMMADDLEQAMSEESMEANWGDSEFTADGKMA